MEFSNLFYIVDNDVAIISFNRPNSLNTETILELEQAFDAIAADDSLKGVVLTGEGDKAFVAGADISELQQKNPETALEFAQTGQRALNKIEQLPKPVIAAVNGFALGGGCEIAMACHMRVASSAAAFAQPEVGLGVIAGFGGTRRLPRLVGKGRVMELLLGGGMIKAAEAYRIGLVNCVFEAFKTDDAGEPLTNEKGRGHCGEPRTETQE